MPYSENTDLPKTVTNVLSESAQEIYRNAFNGAWGDSEDQPNRPDDESREEAAHDAAWGAVKNAADKGSTKWQLNQPIGGVVAIGLALVVVSLAGTFLYLRSKGTKV